MKTTPLFRLEETHGAWAHRTPASILRANRLLYCAAAKHRKTSLHFFFVMFWPGASREYCSSDSDVSEYSDVEEGTWTRSSHRRPTRVKNSRRGTASRNSYSLIGRLLDFANSSSHARRRSRKQNRKSKLRGGICPTYFSQSCGMVSLRPPEILGFSTHESTEITARVVNTCTNRLFAFLVTSTHRFFLESC